MKKRLSLLALATLASGCVNTANDNLPSSAHLLSWMQGSFNSAAQSQKDESYFNIHLNMVQIWPNDTNGPWLYVEQAAEGYLDKPYRQRVYQIQDLGNGQFESKVYTFDKSLDYAGDWKKATPLAALSPDDLKLRPGCSVFLSWNSMQQTYTGSTNAKDCISNLRGASYATSIVSVYSDRVESWDQGFDKGNKQVWGATKAGYIFDKM